MRLKSILIIIIISIFYAFIISDGEKGSVVLHQDKSVKNLVQKHIAINEKYPKIDGFRIQIYSVSGANSRDRANLLKAEFLAKYPDAKVYIVYHAPAYKVRIGDYRTKLEALKHLQTIKDNYPFALVAVDKIHVLKEDSSN